MNNRDPLAPQSERLAKAGKALLWAGLVVTVCLVVLASLTGCQHPSARLGEAKVYAPKDAGTPGKIDTREAGGVMPIPAGSEVLFDQAAPLGEVPKVIVRLSAPTEYRWTASQDTASTGTIDTATAQHRIDKETAAEERKPLLWAAIGAVAAGVVCMVMRWPSVAVLAFIAAGAFFTAWKLAEVPWWAGVLAVVAGAFLVLGYKRAEWDANRDGIPDVLQRTQKTQ
jgi:hypothetical protein